MHVARPHVDESPTDPDIAAVLFDRDTIAARVKSLAQRIADDWRAYTEAEHHAADLTLVPILTGSFIFVADLIRCLPMRLQIRLLSISSYPGPATTSRGPQVQAGLGNLPASLEGAHLLLVDDILDSGRTLAMAVDLLRQRRPASLRTAVLLRKDRPEARAFPVDYVCFDVPDVFVAGYGLDYNDYYRNLPDIVTLRPEVFSPSAPHENAPC